MFSLVSAHYESASMTMPSSTLTIGRRERGTLRRLVMQHLTGIGDVR